MSSLLAGAAEGGGLAELPLDSGGRSPDDAVSAHYFDCSQHDVAPGRHADMGSSCCALFASAVAAGALADASRLTEARLTSLLASCVSHWDAVGDVSGSVPEQMLRSVLKDACMSARVHCSVVDRRHLRSMWSRSVPPQVFLLTALPRCCESDGQPVGFTFAVCHVEGGVHLIDSHRHHVADEIRGMVWARCRSLQTLHEWIFQPSGLLEQLRCRTDLIESVSASKSAPAASASCEVVLDELGDAVVAIATASSTAASCQAHAAYDKTCAECRWRKHGSRFQALSEYVDAVSRRRLVAIRPAAAPAADKLALGCALCARYVSQFREREPRPLPSKWSRFEVQGSGVSLDSIRKHLGTEAHRAALSLLAAPAPNAPSGCGSSPSSREHADALDGLVPRAAKFVEAVRSCLRAESSRAFAHSQPGAAEAEGDLVSTGVFRDESRAAHRKMITAAAAVLDDQQRDMLKNAVRIAFADDDRDQHRILRVRVVWETPQVGCAEFFAALLTDYGFDAAACSAANVEGFKRLCSKRARPVEQQPGAAAQEIPHATLDEPLWEHVRRTIFCGATDGAAVALLGIRQMAGDQMPNLRYQFRDRPHTTRTCVKLVYSLCPESARLRERLITGEKSFARRAKHSRRFQQIWKQKQLDEPDAVWNVLSDLGYAEQRFDSRSKPMTRFLLKLGPALEVLQALGQDPLPCHRDDAKWARSLLEELSGPAGFVKLVMFAMDTDFAVAAHKLLRLQDRTQPDVSVAAHEVQQCVDTTRVLFHEGRVFDRAPNGTYTNALLQGFYGVSRELVLGDAAQRSVKFGWPAATPTSLLKEAVLHGKKLHKAASLCFQYNFPHHAWRARFQAFSLSSNISHGIRREHITSLAEKEGVDPTRAWAQFFEALPHAMRYFKESGDARSAWISYLEGCCRQGRRPRGWRPSADCIVPLTLTYLGVMDGSSDIERNFSHMQLLECRRAKRHHTEQFLQDLLKVRLHAPDEVRSLTGSSSSCDFIAAARARYAQFFGARRLASRSVVPVNRAVAKLLFQQRRPRWQHCLQKSLRTAEARAASWDNSVKRMLSEPASAPRGESFADDLDVAHEEAEILERAAAVFSKRGAEYEARQREAEKANRFAIVAPPPPVSLRSLEGPPPKKKAKINLSRSSRSALRDALVATRPPSTQSLSSPKQKNQI